MACQLWPAYALTKHLYDMVCQAWAPGQSCAMCLASYLASYTYSLLERGLFPQKGTM